MSEYESQADQILELLRARGDRGLTAMEILSEVGSARGAARIKDLRDRGIPIETRMVMTRRKARVACYVLVEPEPVPFVEMPLWG